MAFKQCSIGTKGPKVSPTPLHHHLQPEPLRQGRMDPCLYVLYAKFLTLPSECCSRNWDSSDQTTLFQSSIVLILLSLCELYPPCAVLSWQERHPVWSSAAVAHLLQGSTCCAFRDGILHTLVITSDYLSYCWLSIISNQSAHSPLTSDNNSL